MEIKYQITKDGNKTFSVDSILYHSAYAPEKESERFVDSITLPENTKLLFIIEPGLSYSYKFLKQKYPEIKIIAIRLLNNLIDENSSWDYIINFNQSSFGQTLLQSFKEEDLLESNIIAWNVAEKLFKTEITSIINIYKDSLNDAKTILITRQFFEKKWLINACNNIKFLNQTLSLSKVNIPVIIAASGPSLQNNINELIKNRDKFFLIGLSSALPVLIKNKLYPDLAFSTDGGYWAGKHLNCLINKSIPIAISQESYLPKKLLTTSKILPLHYNDGITKDFYNLTNIEYLEIQRNPTVSGTALLFAKELTDSDIYLCGLDMTSTKGFSHSQPNIFEIENSTLDNKLFSKEKRISKTFIYSSQLNLYKDWFNNLADVKNIFRVIKNPQNKLGNIKDIESIDFSKYKNLNNHTYFISQKKENNDCKKLFNYIKNNWDCDSWKKQIFPADYFSINHKNTKEEKDKAIKNLNDKNENRKLKIRKILDD